jgi:ribosomal RNA-processing protein 9
MLQKRKKQGDEVRRGGKQAKKNAFRDDFLASDSDDDRPAASMPAEDEDPFADETPDERRLRMAREYLKKVESQIEDEVCNGAQIIVYFSTFSSNPSALFLTAQDADADAEEEDNDDGAARSSASSIDRLNQRLQQDVLRAEGRLKKQIAHQLVDATFVASSVSILGRMPLSVTSLSLSGDDRVAYAGCKDGSIACWDVTTGQKLHTFKSVPSSRKARGDGGGGGGGAPPLKTFMARHAEQAAGHIGQVLAVAVSSDGNLLASGGTDKLVRIWDTRTNTQVRAMAGHREIVSALCFREGTHTLYTGSHDRTVKVWDIDQLAYIETLFGHQSEINAIDALLQERALSAGGQDRSVRLWKIPEESQLVYRGHTASIDCAKLINEQLYVSGSQDGSLALWQASKKKALIEMPAAHGGSSVTALGALPYTDLFASGSSDGLLRLWQVSPAATGGGKGPKPLPGGARAPILQALPTVPIVGFLNAITFARSGQFTLVGVGQEHRLGRWQRIPEARNGVHLVKLPLTV